MRLSLTKFRKIVFTKISRFLNLVSKCCDLAALLRKRYHSHTPEEVEHNSLAPHLFRQQFFGSYTELKRLKLLSDVSPDSCWVGISPKFVSAGR